MANVATGWKKRRPQRTMRQAAMQAAQYVQQQAPLIMVCSYIWKRQGVRRGFKLHLSAFYNTSSEMKARPLTYMHTLASISNIMVSRLVYCEAAFVSTILFRLYGYPSFILISLSLSHTHTLHRFVFEGIDANAYEMAAAVTPDATGAAAAVGYGADTNAYEMASSAPAAPPAVKPRKKAPPPSVAPRKKKAPVAVPEETYVPAFLYRHAGHISFVTEEAHARSVELHVHPSFLRSFFRSFSFFWRCGSL